MKVTILASMSKNNVIGLEDEIPWHIMADLRKFRTLTKHCPIIIGRKTFETTNHILNMDKTIVLSRDLSFDPIDCLVVKSLDSAIYHARDLFDPVYGKREVYVVGGSRVFREAFRIADRLELTVVDKNITGDAVFPKIYEEDWKLIDQKFIPDDKTVSFNYSFVTYERK